MWTIEQLRGRIQERLGHLPPHLDLGSPESVAARSLCQQLCDCYLDCDLPEDVKERLLARLARLAGEPYSMGLHAQALSRLGLPLLAVHALLENPGPTPS